MKALREALRKAKKEFGKVVKDAKNSHYGQKYPTLDSVLEAIEPALEANDFDILPTLAVHATGRPLLVTELFHAPSGDSMKAEFALPMQDDPQKQGSAITYGRRYSLCTMLNLIADDDDDGNKAAGKTKPPEQKPAPQQQSKPAPKPQPQAPEDPDDPEMGNAGFDDLKNTYNSLFKDLDKAEARRLIREEHGLSEIPESVKYPDQYVLMALVNKLGAKKDAATKVITGLTRSRLSTAVEAVVLANDKLRLAGAVDGSFINEEDMIDE